MGKEMTPRAIAVVDVGYTNTKVILFSRQLEVLAERKMASAHRQGSIYREINIEPMLDFIGKGLAELDAVVPIDRIVTSAHGACIAAIDDEGRLTVPLMDYMSEPPPEIVAAYAERCPVFEETYAPQLPVALLHAMQLFWQARALPEAFARTRTILPLMQYVAMRLGGQAVSEISSMGCQSHLLDMNTFGPSRLAIAEGWASRFAPRVKAWETIGVLKPDIAGARFQGQGEILAGVHDSNANFLRYLAGGQSKFTLLSTGTWIIGFDSEANIKSLDPARDTVANVSVFGKPVACCRYFGGKEFEIVSGGAAGEFASLAEVQRLLDAQVFALPSFSDSGGPMPGSADRGRIDGPRPETAPARASLASLYCALMVAESLDAIGSRHDIIVDGPFSQNGVFLHVLGALCPSQTVLASEARDGTAAGAACLGLMQDGALPHIDIPMRKIAAARLGGLAAYRAEWRRRAAENAPKSAVYHIAT
jgi:sugar (pentulose or hexulose) kinase